MIEGLSIANFKAFGEEPQEIPLKPLTIVFGANSSGKSSILHSLLYLNHVTATGRLDVKYPRLGERTVDLDGIDQFIHGGRKHPGNILSLSLEMDVARIATRMDANRSQGRSRLGGGESRDMRNLFAPASRLRYEVSIRAKVDDGTVFSIVDDGLKGQCSRMDLFLDGTLILSASVKGEWDVLRVDQLATDHPVIESILKHLRMVETFDLEVTPDELERMREEVDRMVPRLRIPMGGMLPKTLQIDPPDREEDEDIPEPTVLERYFPALLQELLQETGYLVQVDAGHMRYLGPLRSNPPRNIAFSDADSMLRDADGGRAWLELGRNPGLLANVNEWLSGEDKLNASYTLEFEEFFSNKRDLPRLMPDSLRQAIDSFLDRNFETETLGEDDTELKEYRFVSDVITGRASESAEGLSEELTDLSKERNELDRKFREKREETNFDYPTGVYLKDIKHDVEVSHRDVGIGISQVLPVLVHALGSRNRLLLIEQPELHLHPALQAVMGDVFIESALGEGRNRCLLETHSEHLILRILRRIREQSKKQNPTIKASDVAVLYVMPEKDGSKIVQIRVDDDGEFVDPWPGGFFPERLEELI